MKSLYILSWLCVVAGLGFGCSKKEQAAAPVADTAVAEPVDPAVVAETDPAAADGGYDAKVAAAYHATSGAPMSEAQKEAAARAEKQLLDSVERDPKAAEAYKNLQRLRNGR